MEDDDEGAQEEPEDHRQTTPPMAMSVQCKKVVLVCGRCGGVDVREELWLVQTLGNHRWKKV